MAHQANVGHRCRYAHRFSSPLCPEPNRVELATQTIQGLLRRARLCSAGFASPPVISPLAEGSMAPIAFS